MPLGAPWGAALGTPEGHCGAEVLRGQKLHLWPGGWSVGVLGPLHPRSTPIPAWVPKPPGHCACRVCLCSSSRLADKALTLDKAVPLIKALIELNGCSNEQMSGIKSKESDRPINKSGSTIITPGNTQPAPALLIVTRGFMVIGPETGSSQTCPGLVIKK